MHAAAPPPAFVVAAARREAAALGDARPTSARYVLTRHEEAVQASSGASVTTNEPVYLVVLTGRFRTGPVGPAPGRIVDGAVATQILDARTGRETDFSIGPRRVSTRGLGRGADLLPYLRGAALPACSAPDLAATASFQGATGSELGALAVRNRGTVACTLPATPAVTLSWRRSPLAVEATSFPAGWLRRTNPRWAKRVTVLAPGARADLILQWLDWCGPAPWGRDRGFHLTVGVDVPGQVVPVAATTRELVQAPRCDLQPASGTRSTLRVSSFVG